MNNWVLEARGLTKNYLDAGKSLSILSGIDLQIESGTSLAIQGASGSGKSTLLHCLGGLDAVSSGEIIWQKQSIKDLSENQRAELRNEYLGFVYQFHHLLREFTALENVALPLLMRASISVAVALERAKSILVRVGLEKRMDHKPTELSGGERQRVALARALVTQPICVLADEPTGNLDRKTAEDILLLILSLNKELNISFIVVTHDPIIAHAMQRTLQLEEGRLKKPNET